MFPVAASARELGDAAASFVDDGVCPYVDEATASYKSSRPVPNPFYVPATQTPEQAQAA